MGALRRAAPVPTALPLSKRSRGAASAARDPSSTGRVAGANQKLSSTPSSNYTKAVRNGVVVEMEVIPAAAGATTFLKPTPRAATAHRASAAHKLPAPPGSKCAKAIANCGTMARDKPARRAGADEQFPVPVPKRTKVSAVEPALSTLRKRMASELGALHDLVRKAELLCSGKNAVDGIERRSGAPVEDSIKATPEAKRRKVSDLAKIAGFESLPEDKKEEFVDICGGVSPVAILKASPAVEKAGETSNNVSESREPPEDKNDEFVNICDGVCPVVSVEKARESGISPSLSSDSGSSSSSDSDSSDSDSDSESSSSSDSDSDSDSESDPDEPVVDIPVPQAVVAEENSTSAQAPPEPAAEVVQSTEPEKLPKGALPAAAQSTKPEDGSGGSVGCTAQPALLPEAPQPPAQSAEPKKTQDAPPKAVSIPGALYKAKTRRQLLEMERAVVPDESIHDRDLRNLCIAEYGRPGIMRQLGLLLKAEA
ncbi:unnamed protein product [Urochloa humidicola]